MAAKNVGAVLQFMGREQDEIAQYSSHSQWYLVEIAAYLTDHRVMIKDEWGGRYSASFDLMTWSWLYPDSSNMPASDCAKEIIRSGPSQIRQWEREEVEVECPNTQKNN